MIEHTSPVSGIAAYEDKYVATAGYDNQVILWDQSTGSPINRVLHDHLANQCAFNPDGSLLVTSSSDYTARVWSVPELRLVAVR
jgi:WD40 repeat protein